VKKHHYIFWFLLLLIFAAGETSARPRIGVMNFKNNGAPQYNYLEGGIADMLSTALAGSRQIRIVERVQLDKILEELQLGMSGLLDPSTAAQVGKIAGAQYVVIGSFINLGRAIRIDAKVVSVETAVVIPGAIAWVKTDYVENLDSAVHELAGKLLSSLTGENVTPVIRADKNRPGRFEFTFINLEGYSVSIGGKTLHPKEGVRGSIELKHGRYEFRIDRVNGMFNSEPVFQTGVDIPGGYIVRATYKDDKFTIFETVRMPGSEYQVSAADWSEAGFKKNFPPLSRIVIRSKTGLCSVYLEGEEKAILSLPNVDGMSKATIYDIRSGTYRVKVEGDKVWYEGKLKVNPGEEITVQTDPGKFKVVERVRLENELQ
jgi:TolB-like protein